MTTPLLAVARPALLEESICALDRQVAPAQPGDAELVARVRSRVMASIRSEASQRHHTIRAEDAGWEELAPGVLRKMLWKSADAMSCFIRLAPGASVGCHAHPLDEECVVLEGSLRIGPNLLLHAGDFHVGVKGVDHDEARTDTGALVYLRGAIHA